MTAKRGAHVFDKHYVNSQKNFVYAENYAYPILSAYLCDRIAKHGMKKIQFIRAINEKYKVSYSIKFLYNLNKGYHRRTIHLGHINMFTGFFGETILDFCKYYAKHAEK